MAVTISLALFINRAIGSQVSTGALPPASESGIALTTDPELFYLLEYARRTRFPEAEFLWSDTR